MRLFTRNHTRALSIVVVVSAAVCAAGLAGSASGAADAWKPLASGEYQHLYETSFTPTIPATKIDPRAQIDQLFTYDTPQLRETWLATSGTMHAIGALGGTGEPDRYPVVYRDAQGRWNGGTGPTVTSDHPVVSLENAFRYPDTVDVMSRTSATFNNTRSNLWVRTPSGFDAHAPSTFPDMRAPAPKATVTSQINTWGARLTRLTALNRASTPAATRLGVRLVLADDPDGRIPSLVSSPSDLGIDLDVATQERDTYHALRLLQAAPLSPRSRKALIAWMTAQPGAKVTHNVADSSGRVGTRIMFDFGFSGMVAKTTTSASQLLMEAMVSGQITGGGVAAGRQKITIKAHHKFHRFYLSAIVDPTSGALLEKVAYERWSHSIALPTLQFDPKTRVGKIVYARRIVKPLATWEAELYTQDRTRTITPRAAVCADHPDICQ